MIGSEEEFIVLHRLFAATGLALSVAVAAAGCGFHGCADRAGCQVVPRRSRCHVHQARPRRQPRGLGRAELHHRGHRSASTRARPRSSPTPSRFAKEAMKFDKVEVPADQRRQLNLLKVSLVMATPADPKEAEELTKLVSSMRGVYGKGKWCPDPAKPDCVHEHRRHHEAARQVAQRERDPRGVGRLAHDFAADAQGLRALRGAVEQGREGARVRRHRRDVAREVRHAARRVHQGAGSAVGSGAAALSAAARLRADEAAPEVRRRRAGEGTAAGAPARQHLGAGLVEHLRWSRRRTPTPATR